MSPSVVAVDSFGLGLMTMAPLALIAIAGWVARRWWVRQRSD
ncbi:MAG: hypothetical protein ACKO2C_04280 [Actinomycetes bacterium]